MESILPAAAKETLDVIAQSMRDCVDGIGDWSVSEVSLGLYVVAKVQERQGVEVCIFIAKCIRRVLSLIMQASAIMHRENQEHGSPE